MWDLYLVEFYIQHNNGLFLVSEIIFKGLDNTRKELFIIFQFSNYVKQRLNTFKNIFLNYFLIILEQENSLAQWPEYIVIDLIHTWNKGGNRHLANNELYNHFPFGGSFLLLIEKFDKT